MNDIIPVGILWAGIGTVVGEKGERNLDLLLCTGKGDPSRIGNLSGVAGKWEAEYYQEC